MIFTKSVDLKKDRSNMSPFGKSDFVLMQMELIGEIEGDLRERQGKEEEL